MINDFYEKWPDADNELLKSQDILNSKDQDEIDYFLFKFYSQGKFIYKSLYESTYLREFSANDQDLSVFNIHHILFIHKLEEIVYSRVDYELVIYDEIELFREFNDEQFNYPFQNRKSLIRSQTINPHSEEFDADEKLIEYIPYEYISTQVKFEMSYVCLEGQYYD